MRSRLARLAILVATCVASTLVTPAALQAAESPATAKKSVTGAVVTTSGASLVVRTDAGAEWTFEVDASSSVPGGIVSGNRVTVQYTPLGHSRYRAVTVATEGASTDATHPAAPAPSPTPPPKRRLWPS